MVSPATPVRAELRSSGAYGRRFGALLRRHRRARSVSRRSLASRAEGRLSAADLRAYERGRRPLDPPVLQRLCDLYRIPVESSLPTHERVVFDFERRELHIGGQTIDLPDSAEPAPHLARYLAMVNRLRTRPMKSPATLRRDDTEALAEALELDVEEVVELLGDLIGKDAAAGRRLLALRSGTGTLAAIVVIGGGSAITTSRPSEADTAVLSAQTQPAADVAPGNEADDETGEETDGTAGRGTDRPSEDTGEPLVVPDSATVHGPNLYPLMEPAAAGTADEPPASAPIEDETRVDAPGGPVVIERDEGETVIDALDADEPPFEETPEDHGL